MDSRVGDDRPACSLEAGELASRRRRWLELGSRALLHQAPTERGVRLSFRAEPDVEAELCELAELERACGSFAKWTVASRDGSLVLDVAASGEGVGAVRAMFDEAPRADAGAWA